MFEFHHLFFNCLNTKCVDVWFTVCAFCVYFVLLSIHVVFILIIGKI